jgi:tRNA dimethylallyltransferase
MGNAGLRCICLVAPTASGKTELALDLVSRLPLEIVSMDSAMVYRGMDIGTAKPSTSIRARVPHHLVDILDPEQAYSAGKFVADARKAFGEVLGRGLTPLVVGGTLLYLKALREGLAALPRADLSLRRRIDDDAARLGWPALHERLARIDPEAAGRIAAHDRQRIQRALEVYELTGTAISEHQARGPALPEIEICALGLVPPDRRRLAVDIEQRFDDMVSAGFVQEVESLRSRADLTPDMPSMRAVGYRQIWRHLDGDCDFETARESAIVATRQLAKRQMTWLRSGLTDERLSLTGHGVAALVEERILAKLEEWA